MGHGTLRDLGQHRERGLLDGERYVFERDALPAEGDGGGDHAGECDIHALDGVRELIVSRSLPGELFEDRTRIEPHPEIPAELVQHIAYPDILRLPEDPVTAFREGYDLGVAAGRVQERRIPASCERTADLYVRDAMVHTYDRDASHACERPCGSRGDPETGPETRTHGERYEIYVVRANSGLVHGTPHDIRGDLRMMVRGLARVQPSLRRTEHVQLVGQHVALGVHDTYAQRMGRAFNSQREHDDLAHERRPTIKWHRGNNGIDVTHPNALYIVHQNL